MNAMNYLFSREPEQLTFFNPRPLLWFRLKTTPAFAGNSLKVDSRPAPLAAAS